MSIGDMVLDYDVNFVSIKPVFHELYDKKISEKKYSLEVD